MKANFDAAAGNYDATFTNSVIGKLQRQLVYQHLTVILKKKKPQTILEVNCGTGEDAIWMANQHYKVKATDISKKMIDVAKSKIESENPSFKEVDINRLKEEFPIEKFDLLFSNFGGLNCLPKTEVSSFFKNASGLLNKKGIMVLVIMPKNTLWEQLYFLLKRDSEKAFRRQKDFVTADVDGEKVATYYYNPKDIVHLANTNFKIRQYNPIGLFVPPSYLESFLKNKPRLISVLNAGEQKIKNLSWLSKYADHYIIVLQKK